MIDLAQFTSDYWQMLRDNGELRNYMTARGVQRHPKAATARRKVAREIANAYLDQYTHDAGRDDLVSQIEYYLP